MIRSRANAWIWLSAVFILLHCIAYTQCPAFTNAMATGNETTMCEGESISISLSGQNIIPGSTVDFYLGEGAFNPYNGEGEFIGSIPTLTFPGFNWTVPFSFCETYGEGDWSIVGILNPPPIFPCAEIFTPYFDLPVSCPEMSLSGGGIVCEGNCPNDPNVITFFVTGNDLPFEADLEVTASIFPPFAINDLEIFDGQQLFICLGGIFPSFDPSTNTLTIPSFAIGLTATVEVVTLTSAAGCPVEMINNSITLTFIPAPNANAGPDQTICSYEQVTLNGNLGGSATDAVWSTSGDGLFENPSLLSTTYTPGTSDVSTGTVTLTLTGMDEDGACIPATSTMVVTIEPSITIDLGPDFTICNTAIADISALLSDPTLNGIWETDGDGEFGDVNDPTTTYEPGSDDLSDGNVLLYFNAVDPDVCVETNAPLLINIVNAPIVNVPDNIEVCSEDSITIHINVFGNFTSIVWSTSGDGELLLITDIEVNYTPGPQDIADQFAIVSVTVVSGFPECGQTSYNLPIEIILCGCEPFSTVPPFGQLCASNGQLDLSTLLEEGGSGEWSITNSPAGTSPATLSGDNFITDQSDPGLYTVTYTLDFQEPGCPVSSSEVISVVAEVVPEAGASIANCGPAIVFVSGMVTPVLPVTTQWETLGDGSFLNEFSLSTNYIPGSLDSSATEIQIVLHVLDAVCGNKSDTTSILFPVQPITQFSDDTLVICNEEDKGSVVNFFSLIVGGDNSGSWMNHTGVPVNFSDPAQVNFDGIATGYYSFRYQTNSAMFPCQENTYTIVIKVEECLCPLLEIQSLPEAICNDQPNLNLSAFVMAGAAGSWQIINAPPGINPATINGAFFQFMNSDPGPYRLRFTFDSAPLVGCIDSAEVDIIVRAAPLVSIAGDTSSCGLLDISQNAVLSGSATHVLWSTSGLGSFNDPALLNTIYTPSIEDLNSATVTLYAFGIDTSGACSNAIDSVIMQLVHPPNTSWSSLTAIICNNPDSGSVLSLSGFITGGDGTGVWTDENGAGVDLSDPASIDFDGVAAGVYLFSYLTQTAVAPCTDSLYQFNVIVRSCDCPALLIDSVLAPQCIPVEIDLNSLIIDAAPGQWMITAGPAGSNWPVINGSQLTTTGAEAGNYMLTYKLNDSIADCPATHHIPFILESSPVIDIDIPVCDLVFMTYSISFSTDAADVQVNAGNLTQPLPGGYIVTDIPLHQNLSIVISSASGNCTASYDITAPDCSCTLVTEDISDTIFLCPGDSFVLIPFLTGAQGLAFSTWISPDETLMQPTLPLFEANTWVWIVRDMAGCETRDTFVVAIKELIEVETEILAPGCDELNDGSIVIQDIMGGRIPYTIHVDNLPPFVINNLPDTITQLSSGLHELRIRSADGCETVIEVDIRPVQSGEIDLGDDVTVSLGDSVLITPVLMDFIYLDHVWQPDFIQEGITPFWFTPTQNTLIQLLVTDSMGCVYEDEVLVRIFVEEKIFTPNIFSPNDDQINDFFEIYTSSTLSSIQAIEIFDRWGNMLHRQIGSGPFRWDGYSQGKPVNPGVYVVKVELNDQDGNPKFIISDLTIIR